MTTEIPEYEQQQNIQKIRDCHYALETAEKRLSTAKAEYEAEVAMINARLSILTEDYTVPTTDGWMMLTPTTAIHVSGTKISKSPLVSQYE